MSPIYEGENPVPARPLKVFLCHASEDKKRVRELYRRLQADGVMTWLDEENLAPGQLWENAITLAVAESDVVLVCLSTNSVTKRGYVQNELKLALQVAERCPEDTIFLIPVKLEDCAVPKSLSRWHWVHLYDGAGYDRLLSALHLCGRRSAVPILPPAIGPTEHPRRGLNANEVIFRPSQRKSAGLKWLAFGVIAISGPGIWWLIAGNDRGSGDPQIPAAVRDWVLVYPHATVTIVPPAEGPKGALIGSFWVESEDDEDLVSSWYRTPLKAKGLKVNPHGIVSDAEDNALGRKLEFHWDYRKMVYGKGSRLEVRYERGGTGKK